MELQEVLKNIGLDEKETATYMAVLELGTASVYSIAKKAELKRPSVYRILDQLKQRGLVATVPRIKKQLYTAESPERIVGELQRKTEIMKRYMPDFLAFYNSNKEKPQVQLFEGKEAVRQIYQKIYNGPEVWFFGSVREITTLYPEEFKVFSQRVKNGSLKARDLFASSEVDTDFGKKALQYPNYQIRFLKDVNQKFITDCAIYGDVIAFFSFRPQIFVVTISSKEIATTFKTLYEFAWKAAGGFIALG
jgi:sugar-specific transcriptional regulator TrmB